MRDFDVVVIGGGLLGCFAARNLCRFKLHIALIEAREDVCTGVSRANTAIVYPGYDHKPGTLKAEMTVRANEYFGSLCKELDVPFSRCGSLMVSFGEKADAVLKKKYKNGQAMGVPVLQLLTGEETRELEPSLAPGVSSALYAPTAGTVNPWELGIAASENAAANGAELCLNTRVLDIRQTSDGYRIETDQGVFFCRAVINCAGLEADRVQAYFCPPSARIVPDAADYLILDRALVHKPTHIIQYEPEDGGKGFNAVPTVEGSLLLGPSERENEVNFAVSAEGLSFVRARAASVLPGLDLEESIRSFGAVRPNPQREDGSSIGSFVIENPAPGFWSLIGIKTPGLTCADELGRYVAQRVAASLNAPQNEGFCRRRQGFPKVRNMGLEQRAAAVRTDPDYGDIVCICEDVTRAEVLEAIRRGAKTIDGIKRRTGTCMGRCQGGRCQQKLAELLARELGISEYEITKDGAGTELLGRRA
jgi:glycerol-3-phosphate dehydrogenase